SRRQILLTPLDDGDVRVANLSDNHDIPLGDRRLKPIQRRTDRVLTPPFCLVLKGLQVEVDPRHARRDRGAHLESQSLCPGLNLLTGSDLLRPSRPSFAGREVSALIQWLKPTLGFLQSAVGAVDFLQQAAEAMVTLVGLDTGRVLLAGDGGWLT